MTDDEIFSQAINLPEAERTEFLENQFNDRPDELARMEAMISAHERSDDLLDTEAMMFDTQIDPAAPKVIGLPPESVIGLGPEW